MRREPVWLELIARAEGSSGGVACVRLCVCVRVCVCVRACMMARVRQCVFARERAWVGSCVVTYFHLFAGRRTEGLITPPLVFSLFFCLVFLFATW